MKPILAVAAVLIAATVMAGCAPEADSDPDGSRERPFPLSCVGDYRHVLEDGWYDLAGMPGNCVGFQLRSRTDLGTCVFGVLRSQSDMEGVQGVVDAWTLGITSRNVGSVAFGGTVPVQFEHCELFSSEGKRRSAEALAQRERDKQERLRCTFLELDVDSAWRRWADHSAYESSVEDERLYRQYRSAKDAWDRSGCS